MKKTACTILSLLYLFTMGIAQDWAPIRLNNKHHFTSEENNLSLINTIWIDSVITFEGDSIFQLNTIAKIDDCSDPYFCPVDLKTQQFLQLSMTKSADSGRYTFSGERSFSIETKFPLGQLWFFDSDLTAAVDGTGEATVYGQQDSIKIIALSNGESFILSKSFGLLSFPAYWEEKEYEAIGLQESNLGITIPDFWDYHSFEVGDVLQYRSTGGFFGTEPTTTEDIDKYTILSKEIIGDSLLRYEARLVGQRTVTVIMPVVTQKLDTVTLEFINRPEHPTNLYSGTASVLGTSTGQDLSSDVDFGILNCYLTEEGKVVKILGEEEDDFGLPKVPLFKVSESNPDSAYTTGPETYFERYEEDCEMTDFGLFWFEVTANKTLIGYIKDGVQVGEITPDDILLPNKEVFEQRISIRLSPNPTTDFLTINGKEDILSNQKLQIFSLNGQLVLQEILPALIEEHTIQVAHLPKGKYVLKIGGYIAGSFVRQ